MVKTDENHFLSDFDFPFKKLDVSDIVSFKLVPTDEYSYYNMDLYGINSKNEEVLVQK